MDETLDILFAKCQQLPDGDLDTLRAALAKEWEDRSNRQRKAAWVRVCEAIAHYTANFGNINIADYNDGDSVTLCYGQFAFSEYGGIEVGA